MDHVRQSFWAVVLPFLFLCFAIEPCQAQKKALASIVIKGNKRTHPNTILREVVEAVGDSLDRAVFVLAPRSSTSTRQNLMNTGLFQRVDVNLVDSTDQLYTMEISVTEQWYLWPVPILKNAEPNFNTWWEHRRLDRLYYGLYLRQENMRGRNESLYISAQHGFSSKIGLAYNLPAFDKKRRWGAFGLVNYSQNREVNVSTLDNKRQFYRDSEKRVREVWVASAGISHRPGFRWSQRLEVDFHDVVASDSILSRRPDYLPDGQTDMRMLSLHYTGRYDNRNYVAYPLRGRLLEGRIAKLGLGAFDRAPDSWVFRATWHEHRNLIDRERFLLNVGIGVWGRLTEGEELPYFLQQGLGYDQYVRGYEYYVIDGQDFFLGRFNLKTRLLQSRYYDLPIRQVSTFFYSLYLNAFTDAGIVRDNLYDQENPLANEWMGGTGIGLDLVTIYDSVMRLEWSFNRRNEGGLYFHFEKSI